MRFLTISGKEFLPSQGTFRPIVPEVIVLGRLLDLWGISREGLVDLAILVGTATSTGSHESASDAEDDRGNGGVGRLGQRREARA